MKKWLSLVVVCLILTLLPLTANAHSSTGTMLGSNNVETFGATVLGATPCVGEPNILVFYTTFKNGVNVEGEAWNMDASGVEEVFFGDGEDSVRSYYRRSSYGKVNITGTVIEYTARHDASYYVEAYMVLDEILDHFRDEIDWSQYDTNEDSYLDGIILVTKTWPAVSPQAHCCLTYPDEVEGYNIAKFGYVPTEGMGSLYRVMAYMFGIPDTLSHCPGDMGYVTIMETTTGDLSGIVKFVLGWIDDPHILTGTGTFDIRLPSYALEGEIIIIPPNGDAENNAWLILENVSVEGGNDYITGVRFWKTMMNLDEHYNGYPNPFNLGMILTPYHFIQGCANKDNFFGYTYLAGESITPYTYPSTSYVATCAMIDSVIMPHTVIRDLGFSGVSIYINGFEETDALVTIQIDNTPDFPETDAELIKESTTFLSDSSRVEIARIACNKELEVFGDIGLINKSDGTRLPVEYAQTDDFREMMLYLSVETLKNVVPAEYELDLVDSVKTYFGGQLEFADGDMKIDLLSRPIPLVNKANFNVGKTKDDKKQTIDCIPIGGNRVGHFSYEDGIFRQKIVDTRTGSVEQRILELDPQRKAGDTIQYINHIWMLNENTFAALFGYYASDPTTYIALYDLDGNLLDEYIPEKVMYSIGGNGARLLTCQSENVRDPQNPYELSVEDGKLMVKELTNFPRRVDPFDTVFKLTDRYYAYIDYLHGDYYRNVEIFDLENSLTVSKTMYRSTDIGMMYHNDCLYVAHLNNEITSSNTDLVLKIYDSNFRLREEKTLLEQTELTMAADWYMEYNEGNLWMSFYSNFEYETLTVPSTVIITLNENKSVNQYYRHGSKDEASSGHVIRLNETQYYLSENSIYDWREDRWLYRSYIIEGRADPHTYQENITPATCEEDGYSTFVCTTCGDSYTDKYTVAYGHEYVDRVCIHCGMEIPMIEGVIRLSGANRYATGLAVAQQLKQQLDVEKFENIVVASGLNFPDALGGSYLAFVNNAPILLIDDSSPLQYESVQTLVMRYIIDNVAEDGTVYLLGGKSAVSEEFANILALNVHRCVRLSGANRYETNLAILREAGVNTTDEVLIATGKNYADSLSASATGLPMLLVDKELTEAQKEFLENTSKKFVIIGGTGAVSAEIADELSGIGQVTRIKGANRYGTSVEIAKRYFESPSAAVLAYAQGFPDGLCGGPLAMSMNAPLILTSNESFAIADDYIVDIASGAVTGGTGRISDDTVREIFDLPGNTPIVKP